MSKHFIGVISDTHGLLRPEAAAALQGVERIIHAGDFGRVDVLTELEAIAPVEAVRGNVDYGPWADRLPLTHVVEIGGHALYLLHDIGKLDVEPVAAGFRVVIYGHSHKPLVEIKNDVLYLNPGSAGPRRFRLPVTVCHLMIDGDSIKPTIIDLQIPS